MLGLGINITKYQQSNSASFLLDDFSGAILTVSFRLLKSDYTGYCVRIRRSSDNAEQDIGFVDGLIDTASLLTFVGAGTGYVTVWYNQVDTNNMIMTVAVDQGWIVSSGTLVTLNGKPCIATGHTSGFDFLVASSFSGTSSQTYCEVSRFTSNLPTYVILLRGDGGKYVYAAQNGSGSTSIVGAAGSPSYYKNGSITSITNRNVAYDRLVDINYLLTIKPLFLATWTALRYAYGDVGVTATDFTQERIFFTFNATEDERILIEENINNYYSIY